MSCTFYSARSSNFFDSCHPSSTSISSSESSIANSTSSFSGNTTTTSSVSSPSFITPIITLPPYPVPTISLSLSITLVLPTPSPTPTTSSISTSSPVAQNSTSSSSDDRTTHQLLPLLIGGIFLILLLILVIGTFTICRRRRRRNVGRNNLPRVGASASRDLRFGSETKRLSVGRRKDVSSTVFDDPLASEREGGSVNLSHLRGERRPSLSSISLSSSHSHSHSHSHTSSSVSEESILTDPHATGPLSFPSSEWRHYNNTGRWWRASLSAGSPFSMYSMSGEGEGFETQGEGSNETFETTAQSQSVDVEGEGEETTEGSQDAEGAQEGGEGEIEGSKRESLGHKAAKVLVRNDELIRREFRKSLVGNSPSNPGSPIIPNAPSVVS